MPRCRVEEFHRKFGFAVDKDVENERAEHDELVRVSAFALEGLAKGILPFATELQKNGDDRLYRVHLMVEELAEVIQELANRDPVALTKELADLEYVVKGTAVTYGVPLRAAYIEVHRSNMSKSRDPNDPRMKAKDPARGYTKPDIEGVVRRHRLCGEDHV